MLPIVGNSLITRPPWRLICSPSAVQPSSDCRFRWSLTPGRNRSPDLTVTAGRPRCAAAARPPLRTFAAWPPMQLHGASEMGMLATGSGRLLGLGT